MGDYKCKDCKLRAIYDEKPTSFAGHFWRWHINFCPGWKAYFTNLSSVEQEEIRQRYSFTKYSSK